MKKLFLMVAAVACVCAASAEKYAKVTSAPANWSGEYILVYEATDSACVYSGVDVAKGYNVATVTSNAIEGTFTAITIAEITDGYSIRVNGGANAGKYISGTSGKNATTFGTDAVACTLAHDGSSVSITSNTSVMRFNASTLQFRFFKSSSYSSQQPVQLYKLQKTGGSPIAVDAINVAAKRDTLEVGDSKTIAYEIVPDSATDQRVSFATGVDGIVTVDDNGKVTAIGEGDVAVVLTALDSLNAGDKLTDTCYIHVKAATLSDCATVNAETATGVAYKLNEVVVVYVNGANVYVKDESGSTLVYMFDNGLVAGDTVSGIQGTSAPYKGLPELKPTNATSAWTIKHGEAPAIPVAAAAPVADDVNMILTWENVSIEGDFTSASIDNLTGTFGEDELTIRNNFKLTQSFSAEKTYDITAAVALYNTTTVQLYFISAAEHSEPVTAIDEVTVDSKRVYKTIEDGQVVIYRDGVRYNTLGQKLAK